VIGRYTGILPCQRLNAAPASCHASDWALHRHPAMPAIGRYTGILPPYP